MSFPTHPKEFESEDQALVSNVEDILSTCLTPNLVEMESQAAPGPAVEDVGRILGSDTESWMSPLAWLEKGVNTSVMLENFRQSLSIPSIRDAAIGTTLSLLARWGLGLLLSTTGKEYKHIPDRPGWHQGQYF